MGLLRYIKNQLRHDRNIKRKLDGCTANMAVLQRQLLQNTINSRADILREKVMHCTEPGITNEKYCDEEVVVSLTTFGKRINEVYLAIESIMQGTIKPNRIILWLAEDEFKGKTLPITLQKQQVRGLQIEYCEDIRSFKKIVPTMEKYPDASVVTIDDDVIYDFDLLENILNAHRKSPNDVCACRIHRMTLDDNNQLKSYMHWNWTINDYEKSNLNFLTGVGGALYPPHCFIEEFFNKEVFSKLCPFADDVWINAMIWMSGRQISKVYTHAKDGGDFTDIYCIQDDTLSIENTNIQHCRNDEQIKAVFDKYNLYHFLID